MTFPKYIKRLQREDKLMTKTRIAKEIGINRNTLDNLLRTAKPTPIPIESTVRSIMKWTHGEVDANSWYL